MAVVIDTPREKGSPLETTETELDPERINHAAYASMAAHVDAGAAFVKVEGGELPYTLRHPGLEPGSRVQQAMTFEPLSTLLAARWTPEQVRGDEL